MRIVLDAAVEPVSVFSEVPWGLILAAVVIAAAVLVLVVKKKRG